MRSFQHLLIVGFTAFLALSCKDTSSDLELLSRCESVVYSQPELAMDRLDSIQFPEDFRKEARYRYLLRIAQLHRQMDKSGVDNLPISEATAYFTDKSNGEYAALSDFCQGCALMDKKAFQQASSKFESALNLVNVLENPSLKGLILLNWGQMQIDQSEWALSDKSIQQARLCFKRAGNLEQEGDALLNLGKIREQIGDYDLARGYRLEALSCFQKPEGAAKCYLELSQLCYTLGQKDSVNRYTTLLRQTLQKVNDPMILSNSWQFLSNWYQEIGDAQEARFSRMQFDTVLLELVSGKNARNMLNESAKIEQVRTMYHVKLQKGKMGLNATIIFFMLIISIVLIRNRSHRKTLEEAESRIGTLQNLALEFELKEDNLRQLALKHFDVLKKVALLDGMMKDLKGGQEKKILALFNQAVYENNSGFDWDTFFKSLNLLKNGIPQKVRQQYPNLTETEYRILILSFTGLSNKETSIILNLSTNTINSHRSSIRRKLNMPEYGDLEEFVTKQILNKQG